MDPWGDLWIYRELWPSRAYGKPGPCPADDNRYRIRHYVETIYYLESKENPQNEYKGERFDEAIYEREIDYAVRAFGKGTSDDPEQPNFQQRFEQKARELAEELDVDWDLRFKDAKKDRGVGEDSPKRDILSRRYGCNRMHNRHHQEDSREVVTALHPSHPPLSRLFRLAVPHSLVEEIATELNRANGQSSQAVNPVSPKVAPQPEGQQCHSQGQQSNCKP